MAASKPARTRHPEQRERYLIPGARGDRRDAVAISEALAGSDFSSATTSATPTEDGGYLLNGEKWFVTVGDVADYLIVLAMVGQNARPRYFLSTSIHRESRSFVLRATRTPLCTSTRNSVLPT
ncbi:acyl-CoA dehydrogenase family protein [Leucobacter coleopterorum]|uniref:acyl-CoA dehydrogenase family protein n=1 Tax=Leucobacter coleopterorum TaxID=2714933 RepID=UPI00197FC51C|nr:acyl-CoA dehydrogenase family protein [Leucobacter coleopterorum]